MGGSRHSGAFMTSRSHSRRKRNSSTSVQRVPHQFAVDERVLCYEPDMKKARVLYDSKVLEVVERTDNRNKVTVEYKIHFYGWNSSWDRYVEESCVLKDTEENRSLQKDLKHKADELLQGHLKKKKRKKTLSEILKEATKEKAGKSKTVPTDGSKVDNDDGSRSSFSNDESSDQESSEDEEERKMVAQVVLTTPMKEILERDYYNIMHHGMLVKIPADITVGYVLELYVKQFGLKELQRLVEKRKLSFTTGGTIATPTASTSFAATLNVAASTSKQPEKSQIKTSSELMTDEFTKIDRKVRQTKEFVYGIKTVFDFMLYQTLLYESENPQYKTYRTMKPQIPEVDCSCLMQNLSVICKVQKQEPLEAPDVKVKASPRKDSNANVNVSGRDSEQPPHGDTIPLSLGAPASHLPNGPTDMNLWLKRVEKCAQDIMAWRIIPLEYYAENEPDPSMLYGVIHLLRLFVKLPEILSRTLIPKRRLRIICHHVNLMIEYIQNTYTLPTHLVYTTIQRIRFEEDRMGFGALPTEEDTKPEVKIEDGADFSQYQTRHHRSAPLNKQMSNLAKVVEVPLLSAPEALEEHQLTVRNDSFSANDTLETPEAVHPREDEQKQSTSGVVKKSGKVAESESTPTPVDTKPTIKKERPSTPPPHSSPRRQKRKQLHSSTERTTSPPVLPMIRQVRKSAADSAFRTAHIFASQSGIMRMSPMLSATQIKREEEPPSPKRPRSDEALAPESKRITRAADRFKSSSSNVPNPCFGVENKTCDRNSRQRHRSSQLHEVKTESKSTPRSSSASGTSPSRATGTTVSRNRSPASPVRKYRGSSCEKKVLPTRRSQPIVKKSPSPTRTSVSESVSGTKTPHKSSSQSSTTLRLRSRSDERQLRSRGALINALSLPVQISSRSFNSTKPTKEDNSSERRESRHSRDSGASSGSSSKPVDPPHNLRRSKK